MIQRLLTCEDEVAVAERRLADGRTAVATQAQRTREAVKARLARADAIAGSAGLGALYGLWVTRHAAGRAERPENRPGRTLPIPGWLVRAAMSMIVTRLVSGPVGDEVAAGQGANDGLGIEP